MSLKQLEQAVIDIKDQISKCEEGIGQIERSSMVEDTVMRQQRVLWDLVQHGMERPMKCADLQNRLRKNKIRIFQIPEGSDGNNLTGFIRVASKDNETITRNGNKD